MGGSLSRELDLDIDPEIMRHFDTWTLSNLKIMFQEAFKFKSLPPAADVMITRADFVEIFGNIRAATIEPSELEASGFLGVPLSLFGFFDPSNSGRISLFQVFIVLTLFCKGDIRDKVGFCFRMFDTDESGEIEPAEMLEFVRMTGYALYLLGCIPRPPGVGFLAELSSAVFKSVDEDGSNTIDFEEFNQWLVQGKHTRGLVRAIKANFTMTEGEIRKKKFLQMLQSEENSRKVPERRWSVTSPENKMTPDDRQPPSPTQHHSEDTRLRRQRDGAPNRRQSVEFFELKRCCGPRDGVDLVEEVHDNSHLITKKEFRATTGKPATPHPTPQPSSGERRRPRKKQAVRILDTRKFRPEEFEGTWNEISNLPLTPSRTSTPKPSDCDKPQSHRSSHTARLPKVSTNNPRFHGFKTFFDPRFSYTDGTFVTGLTPQTSRVTNKQVSPSVVLWLKGKERRAFQVASPPKQEPHQRFAVQSTAKTSPSIEASALRPIDVSSLKLQVPRSGFTQSSRPSLRDASTESLLLSSLPAYRAASKKSHREQRRITKSTPPSSTTSRIDTSDLTRSHTAQSALKYKASFLNIGQGFDAGLEGPRGYVHGPTNLVSPSFTSRTLHGAWSAKHRRRNSKSSPNTTGRPSSVTSHPTPVISWKETKVLPEGRERRPWYLPTSNAVSKDKLGFLQVDPEQHPLATTAFFHDSPIETCVHFRGLTSTEQVLVAGEERWRLGVIH